MGCVVQYTSCSLSVATSLEIPKHASQAVNNHCFMVLEEQAGDNALYRDSALPYFCCLLLTQETNGMGASPWSHPNEGVCCGVKWSEVKVEEEEKKKGGGAVAGEGGHKCHKNQGAAARPSRRITVAVKWMWKQEKALRNIDLMPQPEQGEDACSRLHALYFPPIQNLQFLLSPQNQRGRLRGCSFMSRCPPWSPAV